MAGLEKFLFRHFDRSSMVAITLLSSNVCSVSSLCCFFLIHFYLSPNDRQIQACISLFGEISSWLLWIHMSEFTSVQFWPIETLLRYVLKVIVPAYFIPNISLYIIISPDYKMKRHSHILFTVGKHCSEPCRSRQRERQIGIIK